MNLDLIYPMAAMVVLTLIMLIKMFLARVAAVREGKCDARYYKTYQEGAEPRELAQMSRHVTNLFETPTHFYVVCVVGIVSAVQPVALIGLAWAYVATRVIHAVIHVGSNKIPLRLGAFFASLLVLFTMWGTVVYGVATA